MHNGEALWTLYTLAAAMEQLQRRSGGNLGLLKLTGASFAACRLLAKHLQLPLPDSVQLHKLLSEWQEEAKIFGGQIPAEDERGERPEMRDPIL
jgi:hypothetical protein